MSLCVVKPDVKDVEIIVHSTKLLDEQTHWDMFEEYAECGYVKKDEKTRLPIEVRYLFSCNGEDNCKGHKIIVLDWEINELARNIIRAKGDITPDELKEKIRWKLIDFMENRDLYFVLGTHFCYGTWMIIGLLYPPKQDTKQKKLLDF